MPAAPTRPRRAAAQETITLRVSPANKKKLLALIDVLHLGKVETLKEKAARLMQNVPDESPLTEDEIMAEIKAYRAEKAAQNAAS